ncbi:MAG TPA: tetratricopeptide repeat protein [Acidimicrobiales bacterium]|nr:tetratricopeptide repeat protein [Acidimicrobiales bacterium]
MAGPRHWGGVARRGAAQVPPSGASDAWRAAARARRDDGGGRGDEAGTPREPAAWEPEEWIDEGELRDEASGAVERSREGPPTGAAGRSRRGSATPARGPADGTDDRVRRPSPPRRRPAGNGAGRGKSASGAASADDDLRKAVPSGRLPRLEGRLREAGEAFRRERFDEARRILRPLAGQAPRAAPVRELYGLSLYRLGRWAQAVRELEAYRSLTGSTEQNPVLADCYRALGRYAEVEELWDELRAASPRAELVAEGRIVTAGALADQDRLDEAIQLLASSVSRATRKPRLHHLRMAYALADLYERAGDLPRARELFVRIAASDADFVDVDARLRALR